MVSACNYVFRIIIFVVVVSKINVINCVMVWLDNTFDFVL